MRFNRFPGYFFAAAMLLFCFIACKSKTADKGKPKENPPAIVDVIIAEPQPVSDTVEANGTVVANEFLELHPEVSGRLTYLSIAEGSPVSQGQVLAKINDADLRATMGKTRVQLDLAEKTEKRFRELLAAGGLNQNDYDAALNAVNGYKADLQFTQAQIDKTVIRAPFSGIAGLRQVSPGAYVTPATVLVTIQQVSKIKLDFTLPETYNNIIKKGQIIDVEFDAATQKRGHAKIIAMEPGANTDTRNLVVRAELADAVVNPGAFVKVFIDAGKGRSSIMVPTNSIIPNDKNTQVVVVKNGMANFVNVKTGNRLENNVEVLSGLNAGDSVAVTGVLFARPKSKLKVRSVKKLSELAAADSTRG